MAYSTLTRTTLAASFAALVVAMASPAAAQFSFGISNSQGKSMSFTVGGDRSNGRFQPSHHHTDWRSVSMPIGVPQPPVVRPRLSPVVKMVEEVRTRIVTEMVTETRSDRFGRIYTVEVPVQREVEYTVMVPVYKKADRRDDYRRGRHHDGRTTPDFVAP